MICLVCACSKRPVCPAKKIVEAELLRESPKRGPMPRRRWQITPGETKQLTIVQQTDTHLSPFDNLVELSTFAQSPKVHA